MKVIRILVFGVLMGIVFNELVHRRRQRAESDAFWNAPYMLEQRREHEECMKHDPKYRLRVAETEAIYGAP